MVKRLYFFVLVFFMASLCVRAQSYTIEKNFYNEWQVYRNGIYEPYSGQDQPVTTVYFLLDTKKFSGKELRIITHAEFSVFINGKLYGGRNQETVLDIDSLQKKLSLASVRVGINQPTVNEQALQTYITSPIRNMSQSSGYEIRQPTSFRDFVVIALLILFIILILMIQLNPKLATDYFSVMRIFSFREGDDNQLITRITNSTNILFYVYCSLLLSYCFVIIFHFVPVGYGTEMDFGSDGFMITFFQWIKLSFIILGFFFIKIIVINSFSLLFGEKSIAGVHFFNWIRLLLIWFGIMTIALFTYFILRGQSHDLYASLFQLVAWTLSASVILVFFKLRSRMSYSMFHLFSYICATEIMPLLITVKVLYY